MSTAHDPVPDGRSGPWHRRPHEKRASGFGFSFDPRCQACIDLEPTGALSYIHTEDAQQLVDFYRARVLAAADAVMAGRR